MKTPCKYCLRPIDSRGMPAHIHFRHLAYVAREFSLQPVVQWFMLADGHEPRFNQLQLPAPNPLTVYPSNRPDGRAASLAAGAEGLPLALRLRPSLRTHR